MKWLLQRLTGEDETSNIVANWSESRAKRAERETYRYLGIRPEPHFHWSWQYRPSTAEARAQERGGV